MFKVNNKDTRTTPMHKEFRFAVFIANFEHTLHLVLIFLLTLKM